MLMMVLGYMFFNAVNVAENRNKPTKGENLRRRWGEEGKGAQGGGRFTQNEFIP